MVDTFTLYDLLISEVIDASVGIHERYSAELTLNVHFIDGLTRFLYLYLLGIYS